MSDIFNYTFSVQSTYKWMLKLVLCVFNKVPARIRITWNKNNSCNFCVQYDLHARLYFGSRSAQSKNKGSWFYREQERSTFFSTDTKCILKMSASINVVNNEDCWSHINNECAAKISWCCCLSRWPPALEFPSLWLLLVFYRVCVLNMSHWQSISCLFVR